jgi:hypothetical protein
MTCSGLLQSSGNQSHFAEDSESGTRRPDHNADGLLLKALLAGGDDGVDLSLMSFPVSATTTRGPAGIDRACF